VKNRVTATLEKVLQTARAQAPLSDRDLLTRYAEGGDQTAFATVVSRHTAMVQGVCQRVLHSQAEAEDACQAVFLILAQRVKTVRWQASAANWLYTTARKVALNARKAATRRTRRESAAAVSDKVSEVDRLTGRELLAALDEELDRLPPRYRTPLVLCYLQELTRDEAALRLGIPTATLKSQLERGRKKLADALTRRGIVLGAGLLAVAATSSAGASSPRLLESILATVRGTPSPAVATLAQEVVMKGLFTRTKWLLVVLAVVGLTACGFTAMPTAAGPPRTAPPVPQFAAYLDGPSKDKPEAENKERTITGKVLGADGQPLEADLALVWIGSGVQALGKSKPDGTFQVTLPYHIKDSPGGWITARAPGHGMDFQPHGLSYLPESMTPKAEVTLKLPRAQSVRGRVLDQQGKPVVGAAIVARSISISDSDSRMDASLKRWVTEEYQRGTSPSGDRTMYYSYSSRDKAPEQSHWKTITDGEGRYELAGLGAGQLITMTIRGHAVADKEIAVLNRVGFDAAALNKEARDNEMKGFSFGGKWQLYNSEPVVVVEPEKIIRGRLTDHEGKPRVGVRVVFSRPNPRDLNPDYNSAITDKDGNYVIRGARKHKGYMVECPSDTRIGLLQCQAFADDTAGYEPITIDLKCARGVVVTGVVKNKATGAPIDAQIYMDILPNNEFVKKYPPFQYGASMSSGEMVSDKEGRFRIVTIPGPVILMASTRDFREEYKPVVADPEHPEYFFHEFDSLQFHGYDGSRRFVQGCWCKVVNAREGDTEITVNIDLDPATKQSVKVVDADDKPVTGTRATGLTHINFANPGHFPNTDTLTVYNVDPKTGRLVVAVHEQRKLIGTVLVKADDQTAVLKLGPGGSVTGRALDPNGKALAGLRVTVSFDHREVSNAFDALNKDKQLTTDATGQFQIDTVFPGEPFRLFFHQGKKRFGPDYDKAPKYTVAREKDTLKIGDLKLELSQDEE
jgi:RNA polymerase sigma factor (sigma-70 family)